MNALLLILRGGLAVVALTTLLSGAELDLAGVYEDAGTIITTAPGQKQDDPVSLHALLSAEFSPGLARLLHEKTGEVRLTHEVDALSVVVVDHEEEPIWRASWRKGDGYFLQPDGRVALHFKPGRFGRDEFVLALSTVTRHRLLQVEVQRRKPTFFGPVYEPMGTYLFHRLQDE